MLCKDLGKETSSPVVTILLLASALPARAMPSPSSILGPFGHSAPGTARVRLQSSLSRANLHGAEGGCSTSSFSSTCCCPTLPKGNCLAIQLAHQLLAAIPSKVSTKAPGGSWDGRTCWERLGQLRQPILGLEEHSPEAKLFRLAASRLVLWNSWYRHLEKMVAFPKTKSLGFQEVAPRSPFPSLQIYYKSQQLPSHKQTDSIQVKKSTSQV